MRSASAVRTPTTLDRFRAMVEMRHFELACRAGSESGEIHGEMHVGIGQEAIAAGMIGSLRDADALISTHRPHLHALAKGVPREPLLAEIYERETGLCRGRGGHMHLFDPARNFSCTGIVGSAVPVAAGYAYAAWLAGNDAVAVAVIGDGATNTGAFHETMNMAGAWKLPLVLVVENNQYAISVPMRAVTATATIGERAAAYSAWGRTVDGTDVDVVAGAFAEAVAHARAGRGPALLEATCHRFAGHYEGDTDHYRSTVEKERMATDHDPLVITRRTLLAGGLASDEELDRLVEGSRRETDALLERVRAQRMPDPAGALDYLFVE